MDKRCFTPTSLHQDGNYNKMPFSEYIELMQSVIRQSTHNPDSVSMNAPYELKPSGDTPKKGVLLIHGLMNSPFELRDLGDYFVKKGFLVRSLLLPGHGTVPGDLLTVRYQAWLDAVEYGIQSFGEEIEELYLCGASMGCLLALYHAYSNDKIKGLILFAPAIQIKSLFTPLASYHRLLSWAWPRACWLSQFPEADITRYLSLAANAVAQTYGLSHVVKKLASQKTLHQSIFMVASADDETISTRAAIQFFLQQKNPHKQCVLYTNDFLQCHYPAIECVKASVPEKNILSLSHVCLTISPQNPYYGEHGTFKRVCKPHIHINNAQFGAINDARLLWQDMKLTMMPVKKPLYRLHYNPHFEQLLSRLDAYL